MPGTAAATSGTCSPSSEPTASRLVSYHNIAWTLDLMARMRAAIVDGSFERLRAGDPRDLGLSGLPWVRRDGGVGSSAATGRQARVGNGTEPMHVLALLAAEEDNGSGAAGLVQIGILLLIPLAMYFLMIRPQRRRVREQQAMQAELEVGDEVMTAAGIYGFITGFEDDIVWVEIDDDVQIRVSRGSLQGKVRTGSGATGPAPTAGKVTPKDTGKDTGEAPGKVTPTVKGVRPDTASGSADTGPADSTTQE